MSFLSLRSILYLQAPPGRVPRKGLLPYVRN
nr:MAG TPA: hypothetical protein [Caudoviricetes sp.]